MKVRVVSAADKMHLTSAPDLDLHEDILTRQSGLSRVIGLIRSAKKPVVGHNCLNDLLRIYGQFVADLPPGYQQMKKALLHAFPAGVFDTKQAAHLVKKKLELEESPFAGQEL